MVTSYRVVMQLLATHLHHFTAPLGVLLLDVVQLSGQQVPLHFVPVRKTSYSGDTMLSS